MTSSEFYKSETMEFCRKTETTGAESSVYLSSGYLETENPEV